MTLLVVLIISNNKKMIDALKVVLLIDCFFSFVYAIFYYSRVPYVTYITFLLATLPPIGLYLYDEGITSIRRISLNRVRLGFYFLSFIFIFFRVGFVFRFLGSTIRTLAQLYPPPPRPVTQPENKKDEEEQVSVIVVNQPSVPTNKYYYYYYGFLLFGVLLLSFLVGFEQTEGCLLSYGLLVTFCMTYLAWSVGKWEMVAFAFDLVPFWCAQIPLFYTHHDFAWVFIISASYGIWSIWTTKEEEQPEDGLDSDIASASNVDIEYNVIRTFIASTVLAYGSLMATFGSVLAVFYTAEFERRIYREI